MWKLEKTKQCEKCPWRVSVNPHDIPDGYDIEKHLSLADTIAEPGGMPEMHFKAMACHEADEIYCVGWLHNQLGEGQNNSLRFRFLTCENAKEIEVVGKQHPNFWDTIP